MGIKQQCRNGWECLDSRKIHIVAAAAMLLIAFDAYHSKSVRAQFLLPSIWATVYTFAAITTLQFVRTGTLRALQVMTAVVAFIGLFRGWAFVLYDGRLSPLGLNTMIACYAYLAHKYERSRMVEKC